MLDKSYYDKTDEIIEHYGRKASSLIPIMQDIQAEYRYLPGELLTYVAKEIGITETKAYSVATFYENFSFEAKGKYVIKVCDGTACHVRKSTPVLEALWKELGLSKKKHTTDDMLFTVETVSCLGACGLAPTMMVNEDVYPAMTPEKAHLCIVPYLSSMDMIIGRQNCETCHFYCLDKEKTPTKVDVFSICYSVSHTLGLSGNTIIPKPFSVASFCIRASVPAAF